MSFGHVAGLCLTLKKIYLWSNFKQHQTQLALFLGKSTEDGKPTRALCVCCTSSKGTYGSWQPLFVTWQVRLYY